MAGNFMDKCCFAQVFHTHNPFLTDGIKIYQYIISIFRLFLFSITRKIIDYFVHMFPKSFCYIVSERKPNFIFTFKELSAINKMKFFSYAFVMPNISH